VEPLPSAAELAASENQRYEAFRDAMVAAATYAVEAPASSERRNGSHVHEVGTANGERRNGALAPESSGSSVQERRNGRHAENGYSTRVHDRTGRHADGGGGEREERRQGGRRGNISSIRVSVVIPALNEARNLRHVLTNLPDNLLRGGARARPLDRRHREVARALRPDIRVIHQTRAGKGNALACGFAACRGDIIVTLDADGSADPKEIPAFIGALVAGADFAKGTRAIQGGGSHDMTLLRRTGNRGLTHLANVLHGTHYSDLCYGYNAFWRACLPQLNVDIDGFEVETLLNLRAAKSGLRVVEVASFELSRIHGQSNLRTFKDGWRVLERSCASGFPSTTGSLTRRPPGCRPDAGGAAVAAATTQARPRRSAPTPRCDRPGPTLPKTKSGRQTVERGRSARSRRSARYG
jgi:hypothetical protein